jgi:hypothetical protein
MVAVRALQRRVVKLEAAGKPRPSPFVRIWGSFDNYVAAVIWKGIRAGALSESDMLDIVETLRRWETDGTWSRVN